MKHNLVFISFVVSPLCVLREPYFLLFLLCSKPCPLPHFTQNKNRSPNTAPRPQVTWLPCPPCHHWLLSPHTLCLSCTLDPPQTRAGLRAFALLPFTLEYSSLDGCLASSLTSSGLSHLHPDHLIHHCKSRLLPALRTCLILLDLFVPSTIKRAVYLSFSVCTTRQKLHKGKMFVLPTIVECVP